MNFPPRIKPIGLCATSLFVALALSVASILPTKTKAASRPKSRLSAAALNPTILYSFDENLGVTANDTSGHGNTASLVNGANWAAGKYNSGINFDGSNDYVSAGSGASIDQLTQITAMAWIYPRTAGQFTSGDFFNKRGNSGSGWRFDISSNRLEIGFSVDYTSDLVALSNVSAIILNTWNHVAVAWDGTPNASNVKLYVNGVEVAHSRDFDATGPRVNDSSNNLIVGNNNGTDQTFDGIIDEARVYDRALSQAEIQADMNTQIGNPPAPPDVVGQWSPLFSTPILAVHTTLLKTGEVLIWGAASGGVDQWLWNPSSGVFTKVTSGDNLFCSGQTVLPNGKAMSIGGHANYQVGIKDIDLFDPNLRTWSVAPQMTYGRWYPTGTVLGDGRILVLSGNTTCGTCMADIPEVYDPIANAWSQLNGAQYTQPTYPYMFVLPNGKVLYSGSDSNHTITRTLDVQSQTWTTLDSNMVPGGSAVMYLPGKVLKSGSNSNGAGTVPSLNSAYVFDATLPTPSWRQVGSMAEQRSYHTLTVLPDGTALATSGVKTTVNTSNIPALSAEIWNPQTETWTQLSSAQVKRAYHSTALLLPDGRVLVAGSGGDAAGLMTNELNAEIFSPPYLFKGPRPTITSVPANMGYGLTYSLSTPNAATISSVSLVRSGAVTHTFNNDQRYVPLTFFQNGSGGLDIQIPGNPNVAPPGYYMLYIIGSTGVPSVASFVNIQAGLDSQPPTDPSALVATVVGLNAVDLSWTGSTDNVGVSGYDVHRSTSPGFTPSIANRIAQVTTTSYSDPGLAVGTYYYKVIARDAAANSSGPSNEAFATITPDNSPPTAPTLAASVVGMNSVDLVWGGSTDNVGVTGYDVHRSTAAGFTPSIANRIAQVTLTSYTDPGLAVGTYYYKVVAKDGAGNVSLPSNEATATVLPDMSPPTAPNLLSATPLSSTVVRLTWQASQDNVAVTGYRVIRNGQPGNTTSALTYDDTGLSPSTTYVYEIEAFDAAGNVSQRSNALTANTPNPTTQGVISANALNEGFGATTSDASGNGNNGVFVNGPSWTTGQYGNAILFHGTNDYVNLGSNTVLDNIPAMTISVWIRPNTQGSVNVGRMLDKRGTSSSSGWQLAFGGTRGIDFRVDYSSADLRRVTVNNVIPLNAWTHIAVTWNGSGSSSGIHVYINGVEQAYQSSFNGTGTRVSDAVNNLILGNDAEMSGDFNGVIDNVRIYNRVLTLSEIQTDLNTGI